MIYVRVLQRIQAGRTVIEPDSYLWARVTPGGSVYIHSGGGTRTLSTNDFEIIILDPAFESVLSG
jgi:hypothetical protein